MGSSLNPSFHDWPHSICQKLFKLWPNPATLTGKALFNYPGIPLSQIQSANNFWGIPQASERPVHT